jgi:hypothetical protein
MSSKVSFKSKCIICSASHNVQVVLKQKISGKMIFCGFEIVIIDQKSNSNVVLFQDSSKACAFAACFFSIQVLIKSFKV